jgi:hypothetical protein
MLNELALPAGVRRCEHRALEDQFAAAVEPQMKLLTDSGGRGTGEAHFVIRHLVGRVIDDLMVALYLATHGYLPQTYGALRTATEALDLLDLVAAKPEEAANWVSTKTGHVDFRPGEVRKRLGRDSFDELYSQYSEFAHPRFAGSRLSAIGKRALGSEDLSIVIQVGPSMLDELPDHWFAVSFLMPTIARLSITTSNLITMGTVTEPDWDAAVIETNAALSEMAKLVGEQLAHHGVDTSALVDHFAKAAEIIDQANRNFPKYERP